MLTAISRNVFNTSNQQLKFMEINNESQFDQFEKKIIRRKLLPIWMKIFCWIFMFMGVMAILSLLYGAFGNQADLSFYGLQTTRPISVIGICIVAIMVFKAFTAYSLWFEKDNAIILSKIDSLAGIFICIISMFLMPFIIEDSIFSIRLEILFLIPYYMKISKIEYEWDNLESL